MTGTENRVEAIPIHAGEGLPLEILLVEDSPSDVAMTVAALQEGRIAIDLHVVGDGEDALAFLRRAPGYEDAPRPDMVFLDLNLPRKDGREVLDELKNDADLASIPVVVLTTSAADSDIARAYAAHANAYVTKPTSLDAFLMTIGFIEDFWLSLVQLPPRPDRGQP